MRQQISLLYIFLEQPASPCYRVIIAFKKSLNR